MVGSRSLDRRSLFKQVFPTGLWCIQMTFCNFRLYGRTVANEKEKFSFRIQQPLCVTIRWGHVRQKLLNHNAIKWILCFSNSIVRPFWKSFQQNEFRLFHALAPFFTLLVLPWHLPPLFLNLSKRTKYIVGEHAWIFFDFAQNVFAKIVVSL